MPAKFEEDSLIWVAADQPLKDNSFLSAKILDLCKDVPIFWLRPTYPNSRTALLLLSLSVFSIPLFIFFRVKDISEKTYSIMYNKNIC